MYIDTRHIIHAIVYGKKDLRKALLTLYSKNRLQGAIGHQGILLVRKIKAFQELSEEDKSIARSVVRSCANVLAELANEGYFKLND